VNTFDAEDMGGVFLRDILRRLSSSLYGSDALGGVVRTRSGPNITAP
jgi:outer membrane receptor protein involved in Fe transport